MPTTQYRQVTENVTQQYAVNVPVQVPVTVMTTQQKQVTENVTQQYAVSVPVQVPVTVMTTQQKQVTENVTRAICRDGARSSSGTVMTTANPPGAAASRGDASGHGSCDQAPAAVLPSSLTPDFAA